MRKTRHILFLFSLIAGSLTSGAVDFMDTSAPEKVFDIGFRLGVNTSNRSFSRDYFKKWNVNGWGTGFVAGAVVNLNMRDWFAVQPGFFYDVRSSTHAFTETYIDLYNRDQDFVQMGRVRTYNFTIPVLASFRFNLSPVLRWTAEAGPYAMYRFKGSDNNKVSVIYKYSGRPGDYKVLNAHPNKFDAGLKIGTGLEWKRKISANVHYIGGFMPVWKSPFEGGRHKEWTFTVGYTL